MPLSKLPKETESDPASSTERILGRLEGKVDSIVSVLSNSAQRTALMEKRLSEIDHDIGRLTVRIAQIETRTASTTAFKAYLLGLIGTLIALFAALKDYIFS